METKDSREPTVVQWRVVWDDTRDRRIAEDYFANEEECRKWVEMQQADYPAHAFRVEWREVSPWQEAGR